MAPDDPSQVEPNQKPHIQQPTILAPARWTVGVMFAVIITWVLYCVISASTDQFSIVFFSFPIVLGFIIGVFALKRPYLSTSVAFVCLFAIIILTYHEGITCFVMSLPVLAPITFIGTFVGNTLRRWLKTRNQKAVSVIVLVVLYRGAHHVDQQFRRNQPHPRHQVSAEILIKGKATQVFAAITGVAPEQQGLSAITPAPVELAGPWPTVMYLGLPIPQRLQITKINQKQLNQENKAGNKGELLLTFNHGVAHAQITEWSPPHDFAFTLDGIKLNDPPHFNTRLSGDNHFGFKTEKSEDWLTFGRLAYQLEMIGQDHVKLTRITEFTRHLFPDFYFGPLQEWVITQGSKRLLQQIQSKVEQQKDTSLSQR